ncbi:MAG TPA: hypothetical protein VMV14_03680 [Acidimicrobiales bacterium]|nr:hypothetical protein [Acidimicrobiales bacterium]
MVSSVIHNACLRMEASGTGINDVVSPSAVHRWLGRGGLAVGGAASLAIGAVLGGALESVPVLLPPPAAAQGLPQVTPKGLPASVPWALAANALPGYEVAAPTPAVAAQSSAPAPTVVSPSRAGSGPSATVAVSPPARTPAAPPAVVATPKPSAPAAPAPTTPPACSLPAGCSALSTAVTAATGVVGTVVQSVTAAAPALAPVTASAGSVVSSVTKVVASPVASSSPLSGAGL